MQSGDDPPAVGRREVMDAARCSPSRRGDDVAVKVLVEVTEISGPACSNAAVALPGDGAAH